MDLLSEQPGALDRAHQQRAQYLNRITRQALRTATQAPTATKIVAAILSSLALVAAYAAGLSEAGLTAATPALFAVLLASTLSSIAGFAFSAICGVMLVPLINDPVQVVETMMVCSIAIQSLSVVVLWRDIEWSYLPPFLLGGLIGLPAGVELLIHLHPTQFRQAIGALLIVYAAYALLKRPIVISSGGKLADASIGFLGGITGGLAGFPGAPVTVWCALRGWSKTRQRTIYQPFILIMQILALALIQLLRGVHGQHELSLTQIQFAPVALLGTWFGLNVFRRMSDRTFNATVNLLLLVSGLGLVV